MKSRTFFIMVCCILFGISATNWAALIPFDTQIKQNIPEFTLNADEDPLDDITFTSESVDGLFSFNVNGNYRFLSEGAMGANSLLNNPGDLRIDFDSGAVNTLAFSFALGRPKSIPTNGAQISVFDASGNLLGTNYTSADFFTLSNGKRSISPEGFCSIAFSGIASYALIDVTSTGDIGMPFFIVDNLSYTPVSVPEPNGVLLLALGLLLVAGLSFFKVRIS